MVSRDFMFVSGLCSSFTPSTPTRPEVPVSALSTLAAPQEANTSVRSPVVACTPLRINAEATRIQMTDEAQCSGRSHPSPPPLLSSSSSYRPCPWFSQIESMYKV